MLIKYFLLIFGAIISLYPYSITIHAADKWRDLLANYPIRPLSTYTVSGKTYYAQTNDAQSFEMTFQFDPFIKLDLTSPDIVSSLVLTPQFEVKQTTFKTSNPELTEKLTYDHRIGSRNDYDQMVFDFYKNGASYKTKSVYYPPNTLDTFSILALLQLLCQIPGTPLIMADLGVQHRAIRVPILLQKNDATTLSTVLNTYTLPPLFVQKITPLPTNVVFFTMKVTGWQGLLYNHRHYYAFDATFPHNYVGHWGGPDEMNIFSWRDSIKTQPFVQGPSEAVE